MKRYLLIIVHILIATAINAQTYKYTSANLRLRSGPSTSYKILLTIPLGTSVEMSEDCACDWIRVSYNGYIGYVSSKYLTDQRLVNKSSTKRIGKNQKRKSSVRYYKNSGGEKVQSPKYYNSAPAGATALCRDGTYSFSRNRRGTCSHHGGVAKWLR